MLKHTINFPEHKSKWKESGLSITAYSKNRFLVCFGNPTKGSGEITEGSILVGFQTMTYTIIFIAIFELTTK